MISIITVTANKAIISNIYFHIGQYCMLLVLDATKSWRRKLEIQETGKTTRSRKDESESALA